MFKRANWTVNPRAVDQACHTLGLNQTATVTVKRQSESAWWGVYDVFPLHAITLSTTIPKTHVSVTLWHELGHALQCERDYDGDGDAFLDMVKVVYDDFMDGENTSWDPKKETYTTWKRFYYDSLPMEQEAEDIAQRYAKRFPLVV